MGEKILNKSNLQFFKYTYGHHIKRMSNSIGIDRKRHVYPIDICDESIINLNEDSIRVLV